jgi:hypothetical protein
VPGGIGGGTGGVGSESSGCTQAERSKKMNSSALPVGDIGRVLHPLGNVLPSGERSPPVLSG